MNHNFGRDLLALDRLLPFRLRYIGLLGPRRRHAELLARLSEYRPLDLTRARETCSRLLDSTSAAKHLKKSRFQLHPKLLPCFPIVVVVFCASARTTFTEPRRLAQRPRSSNALAPVIQDMRNTLTARCTRGASTFREPALVDAKIDESGLQ